MPAEPGADTDKVNSFLNKNKTTIMEYLSSLKTQNGNLDYDVFLKGIPDILEKILWIGFKAGLIKSFIL